MDLVSCSFVSQLSYTALCLTHTSAAILVRFGLGSLLVGPRFPISLIKLDDPIRMGRSPNPISCPPRIPSRSSMSWQVFPGHGSRCRVIVFSVFPSAVSASLSLLCCLPWRIRFFPNSHGLSRFDRNWQCPSLEEAQYHYG
jgi:hypothetical protein